MHNYPISKLTFGPLDDGGVDVRVPLGSRIFTFPYRPDGFWGPPNSLSNGYRGLFLQGKSCRGVKLTIHLQLVPKPRQRGSMHPLPVCLRTRTTVSYFLTYTQYSSVNGYCRNEAKYTRPDTAMTGAVLSVRIRIYISNVLRMII
jgi:hypothetical protein